VHPAEDLSAARFLWQPNVYDLILLDVRRHLPGEALEFYQQIKETSPRERFAFLAGPPVYLSLTSPEEICRLANWLCLLPLLVLAEPQEQAQHSDFMQDSNSVQVTLALKDGKTSYRMGEAILLDHLFTATEPGYAINTTTTQPASPIDEITIIPLESLFRFIVKPKMPPMLLHHLDLRSVTDHLPLLCFVEHSSQRPQGAVGIRGRAGKFQLFCEISCDLVDSQTCNGCRLQ
jgi:hypothetical protein